MRTSTMPAELLMSPEENRAFFKKFGKRLASLRKDAGLTQVQLAEVLGYSQTQVASFETGRRRIPVSALPVLTRTFGISFEELFGVQGKPRRRGPTSKLERQLERLSKLPRSKQKVVSEMLDGILQQAS